MIRVTIIGSGGVAESLALGVSHAAGLSLQQIWGRNTSRVESISAECGVAVSTELLPADIYIIATSDRAIAEVSASLNFPPQATVVHTAGSVSVEVIAHPRRGVLYPLQTFSVGRKVDISEVPMFVEGEEVVVECAKAISCNVMELDSEGRKQLHLCAVFACNFANAMFATAAEIAASSQIPFDLLKPLIKESCAKALASHSPLTIQTGPARRGDEEVQTKHIEMLKSQRLKDIYKIISEEIWETSKKM